MFYQYFDQFLIIAIAHVFAVMSPGPDFLLVVRQSFLYGRKKTIFTSIGIASGILVHTLYCTLGLSFLLSYELFYIFFKMLCATYLLYLGLTSLLTKNTSYRFNDNNIVEDSPNKPFISSLSAYKQGFITNVFNIKASLFFISLYSFINPETPKYILFFYSLWMTFVTGFWFILLTLLLTKIKKLTYKYHLYINKFMGIVLIYIAIKIYLNY